MHQTLHIKRKDATCNDCNIQPGRKDQILTCSLGGTMSARLFLLKPFALAVAAYMTYVIHQYDFMVMLSYTCTSRIQECALRHLTLQHLKSHLLHE